MPREWAWVRDPNNWYWFIGSDDTQVYSSSTGDLVPVSDPAYLAWLAASDTVTAKIGSIDELGSVLADLGAPPPVNAGVLTAYKNSQVSRVDTVIFRVLFNHENRIRALAGQPAISAQQFITAIKALL